MAVKGFVLLMFLAFFKDCTMKSGKADTASQQEEAVQLLRTNLQTQQEWVKVHAAEFLLRIGNPQGVRDIFTEENSQFENQTPYRIGIWRVLAQVAESPVEKQKWINKILLAFADENGNDRIHASETLAKLKVSPLTAYPEITKRALESRDRRLSLYTRWCMSFTSADSLTKTKDFFLRLAISRDEDSSSRSLAAYVIRQSGLPDQEKWKLLAESALTEPNGQGVKLALLNAAFVTTQCDRASSDLFVQVYHELMKYRDSGSNSDHIKIADALAEKGKREDIAILSSFQDTSDVINASGYADLSSFAAYAIIRILERK